MSMVVIFLIFLLFYSCHLFIDHKDRYLDVSGYSVKAKEALESLKSITRDVLLSHAQSSASSSSSSTKFSPSTGRAIRANAGRNKHLTD